MNTGDPHDTRPQPEASAAASSAFHMNTFQWLLVLGFPVNVAAAQSMPELFSADDALDAESDERARERRLQADRAVTNVGRWA